MSFRLTYSTMFNPPQEMHDRFDAAVEKTRAKLGGTYGHFINGQDVIAESVREDGSPINTSWVLGRFSVATDDNVRQAVAAAKGAFPGWRATPAAERIRLLRRVGELIEERVYDIAAAVSLEVGKNRMEAIGEIQETADFYYHFCNDFEKHQGFDHQLPDDPLPDFASHNRSVMKPYGAWAVVSPFNFPFALAGGPAAAAMVTGNTVVVKGAPETPWAVRLLAECIRDAGIPDGVFNCLLDPEDTAGPVLVDDPDIAGVTFTGSHDVGMQICRKSAEGRYPKPCIAEMGGKNAAIITKHGNLDRAVLGIMRSAFGLTGQKCSALSRVYVEDAIADALIEKLKPVVDAISVGDPTRAENYLGPIAHKEAYEHFKGYIAELRESADVICGGDVATDGELADGYYCMPTVAEAPLDHRLWGHEMFAPVVMISRVPDKETGMQQANDTSVSYTHLRAHET